MTDQIKAAATEYPDELRVVMETAGWCNGSTVDGGQRWMMNRESVMPDDATDNDAIVAAIKWITDHEWPNQKNWMISPRLVDWLQWIRDNTTEAGNAQ